MNILSIQLGHNATVGLLKDGEIIGLISQEKFDNIKNSSAFPKEAIEWLLDEFKVDKVDYIAVSGLKIYPAQTEAFKETQENNEKSLKQKIADNLFLCLGEKKSFQEWYFKKVLASQDSIQQKAKKIFFEKMAEILKEDINDIEKKTVFVEHHKCHAYSAFYALNKDKNEKALIVTLDGSGDYYAATVNLYENGEIKRIASTKWIYSIGYIYSKTTVFLGLKPLEHEYKVMGLAPYAKEEYVKKVYEKYFKDVIWIKDNLEFEAKIPTNRFELYLKENVCMQRFDNIAGAVQKLTEELVTKWIDLAMDRFNVDRVYTGGGVFMNVKLNKKIMELDRVKKPYFMPSCGDESNPIGAAFYVYKEKSKKDPKPLKDLFLGIKYSNDEVKEFLKKYEGKYLIKYYENIEEKIASLLADFKVVARFWDRCEWGARSLGNRAILGNASDMNTFYEINDMIKKRDFWIPFAPSILKENASLYIKSPKNIDAPYMIVAFDSTDLAKKHLIAAMHQADHTLRAQLVDKEINPHYHKIISEFKKLTGIGGILNTSFNLHGYPLVATLDQAMFTFENSGLKYLALQNYLVSKEDV